MARQELGGPDRAPAMYGCETGADEQQHGGRQEPHPAYTDGGGASRGSLVDDLPIAPAHHAHSHSRPYRNRSNRSLSPRVENARTIGNCKLLAGGFRPDDPSTERLGR